MTSRSEPVFSTGSVKVHDYLKYSVQFRFALVIFKITVRVRLRFGKNGVKPVYKTSVRVRFDSLLVTLSIRLIRGSFNLLYKVNFSVKSFLVQMKVCFFFIFCHNLPALPTFRRQCTRTNFCMPSLKNSLD